MINTEVKSNRPIIVSLTSIPSRFAHLPKKVSSLLNQSVAADAIEIYIPKYYRRFIGHKENLPKLPSQVNVIYVDEDMGPATKLLYAMERYKVCDVDILICDDDRLQDYNWVNRFKMARNINNKDIICERGWNIKERFDIFEKNQLLPRAQLNFNGGKTFKYRLQRAIGLGLYHPNRNLFKSPGYVDIFEGFLGALVPARCLPDKAWQIPDILWTVDDVWLSGMARLNGVGVWAHGLPRPVYGNGRWDKVDALTQWAEQGFDRKSSDLLCINYMQNNFQIWQ